MNRAPSLKALVSAFPVVSETNLKLIRKVWREPQRTVVKRIAEAHAPKALEWARACFNPPSTRAIRHRVIDELFETHGVEFLGVNRRTGEDMYYCNTGETYDATLIFHGRNMRISTWGDLVERNAIREAQDE